jgi:hypothetical protein
VDRAALAVLGHTRATVGRRVPRSPQARAGPAGSLCPAHPAADSVAVCRLPVQLLLGSAAEDANFRCTPTGGGSAGIASPQPLARAP